MAAALYKRIRVGRAYVRAYRIRLLEKYLLVLVGKKGYIMCGYLDMSTAEKFGEVAVRVTGVSSIGDVLVASVAAVSTAAKRLGIKPGQSVRQALTRLV